ncbi:NlpC/P60 family protein [Kibdelosporangium persicum]|uniref:Cell wall-associated hydrolase n=1 Tax=Kibdelosporangium persicum TaxID=2698649 RepID=A0ABX2F3M9_9PSEU|nr:NlpC/P60 family protein [Kibdelosporangium persicum]NRN65944.1 Cell wall-associated hydrolase [Kibdelosporangium persicum]
MSSRLKRGVLTASAVITLVGALVPVPAFAQQESPTLQRYRELNTQAKQLNEDYLKAVEDRDARQADITKAGEDMTAANRTKAEAKVKEDEFRGQVDTLSQATFRGARFDKLSALLTGTSAKDFLARSSALNVLATDNNKALQQLVGAVTAAADAEAKAADAQKRATEARDAAAKLAEEIKAKKAELDKQINEITTSLDKLSPADRAALQGELDKGVYLPGNGIAGKAVTSALSRRGDRYALGGTKPPVFDCSGLVMWAYAQHGHKLPRTSREQFKVGRPVSKSELQPGDLLFYGNSAATIHHVVMYIGRGMIVHASDYGIPVLSAPMEKGGKDFFGAKRPIG